MHIFSALGGDTYPFPAFSREFRDFIQLTFVAMLGTKYVLIITEKNGKNYPN